MNAASESVVHDPPNFLFVTCQVGAEGALKQEMSARQPDWKLAFSRPGFVTLKLPTGHALADDFELGVTLAREYGFVLGKAVAETAEERASETQRLAKGRTFDDLAVFPRDEYTPGFHGFQPSLNAASRAAEPLLRATWPNRDQAPRDDEESVEPTPEQPLIPGTATRTIKPGSLVLDVVLVEPNTWYVGFHRQGPGHLPWPGGLSLLESPQRAVSRAYVKCLEALAWSGLPLQRGQWCAELGSSPGGASQALLEMGLNVMGIDPAEMDPRVLEHPNFTHVRKRSHEVRRREFRKVKWLLADMNVAPQYTLDAVDEIVQHPETNVRGLLLTLKLLDWKLVAEIPAYLDRIRSWGFRSVRSRQLSRHHQEFAVAALRHT